MAMLTLDDCTAARSPGRLVRRIDKLMTILVESHFPAQELSFANWVALKVVRDDVASTAGELSRELSITTGATTRMIDMLEQRGLIERGRGAADRRVVRLSITEAGRAVVAELQHSVLTAWNEVLADFDQTDVDRIVADLRLLLAAAERVVCGRKGGGKLLAEAAE